MPQKVIIKRAYGMYSKGAIVEPSGLFRDFLINYGYAEKYDEPDSTAPAVAPAPEQEHEDLRDIEADIDLEDVKLVDAPDEPDAPEGGYESAVAPPVENAARRRGRPRRNGN